MAARGSAASDRFQWNAGGWIGSQVGGSCWMAVAGLLLLAHDLAAAAIALSGFVAVNGFGLWLWSRRERLSAYRAGQLLLAALAVVSLLVTLGVDRTAGFEALSVGPPVHAWQMVVAIVTLFPALALAFHLAERRAREQRD